MIAGIDEVSRVHGSGLSWGLVCDRDLEGQNVRHMIMTFEMTLWELNNPTCHTLGLCDLVPTGGTNMNMAYD